MILLTDQEYASAFLQADVVTPAQVVLMLKHGILPMVTTFVNKQLMKLLNR